MTCLTLITDFGLQDASAASVRGTMMQHVPDMPLIDISHQIEPHHLLQAAYVLISSYSKFPIGSFHIIIADVYREKEPRFLLCIKNGHYFIAPDNGLLAIAFDNDTEGVWECYQLKKPNNMAGFLHSLGSLIATIKDTGSIPAQLGQCSMMNAPQHLKPVIKEDSIECHVIHVDRFGNVVINLTRQLFDDVGKGRNFSILIMRNEEISSISHYYNDVGEGKVLSRFNSNEYLEICIHNGNAAGLLGLKLHKEHHFIYNTIKISFS